jgi:parvulin-like peptidyl-prolyl isomerase
MRAIIVLVGLIALSACPSDPRDEKKSPVVATIGDQKINETEFLAELSQRGTARIADSVARNSVARAVLDSMIGERLMLQAADKAGINVRDDEVEREVRARKEGYPPGAFERLLVAEQLTRDEFRASVKRHLTAEAFLRAKLAQAPPITEGELKKRFETESKDQKVSEQVRARQILVKTSEEATHVLDLLQHKKITFEAAAQKYSTAPDAENGGDLGWFSKGDMPDVFDVCFNLDKGVTSDIVASDYGFHIFQIVDRREEHPETFESARERIEEEVMRERQDEAYQKLLNELREETKVHVVDAAVAHVVSLLPPAPIEPATATSSEDNANARSLDSLPGAIDPTPPVPGQKKAKED